MSASDAEFLHELSQTLDFKLNVEYPSRDSGFNIINILSSNFEDEGFPTTEESPSGGASDGNGSLILNSMLLFIFVQL